MGAKKNSYMILVGKPKGKIPLGKPIHRSVDNIKMDLGEIRWVGMDWINVAQERDQRTAHLNLIKNLRIP
jgi:hypothetical protein